MNHAPIPEVIRDHVARFYDPISADEEATVQLSSSSSAQEVRTVRVREDRSCSTCWRTIPRGSVAVSIRTPHGHRGWAHTDEAECRAVVLNRPACEGAA